MDKAGLLKSLAETGYNVGFGAKKHFATFDIVEKGPGWIAFISAACGVYALIVDQLTHKLPSATLVVAGMVALYISFYRSAEYDRVGKELTVIFDELRDLYRAVQAGADVATSYAKMKELEHRFYAASISKQILFSDWYAHFKFFGQHQVAWVDEQLHFGFWKDKLPVSAKPLIFLFGILSIWWLLGAVGWVAGPAKMLTSVCR